MKKYSDAKSYARQELSTFYEMDENTKNHLFGEGNVKRVFVGYGDKGEETNLNWDEYIIPKDSGIVIEFNDGRCFSIYPFDSSLTLEVNTDKEF